MPIRAAICSGTVTSRTRATMTCNPAARTTAERRAWTATSRLPLRTCRAGAPPRASLIEKVKAARLRAREWGGVPGGREQTARARTVAGHAHRRARLAGVARTSSSSSGSGSLAFSAGAAPAPAPPPPLGAAAAAATGAPPPPPPDGMAAIFVRPAAMTSTMSRPLRLPSSKSSFSESASMPTEPRMSVTSLADGSALPPSCASR